MTPPARHPVDELPAPTRLLAYGLQHVLAMYAGAVAVPLILAHALKLSSAELVFLINADLFTCGLATLLQTLGVWRFGIRLPVIQGVTFAAVTPMILIGQKAGLRAIYGAVMVAGLVTILAARHFSKLLRLFPPIVTGTTITIIGITLLPVAARWAGGGNPADPAFGGLRALGLAFGVLVMILVFNRLLRGFAKNLSVLLGLIAGTALGAVLGITDFSAVSAAGYVGITRPFAFGWPVFDVAAIVSMTAVMLVVMVETTGDFVAIGEIVDKPIGEGELAAGLRADGLSTFLGGVLNAFPYTAYAQNVGLVGLTQVKSRYVVAAAGGLLMLLGLFPKAAAVVACIPPPVLGGAGLVMFGTVAVTGIKTLARVDFSSGHNTLIVAVSVAVGLIPLGTPGFYQKLPSSLQVILQSGITVGSLVAVVLNAILSPQVLRAAADEPTRKTTRGANLHG